MKVVAVLMLVCGCFVSPVVHFGAGKSAEESQHAGLSKLMPAQLAAEGEWRGEVHVAKIRVWADDDYRAQNIRWETAFAEELAYVNEVLAPLLGVRLEAEYHAWDRHAPGATLADSLAALAQQDSGADVLSVVGLTSSLSLVTATFEQLGYASIPGRHLMVRGYADVDERKAFASAFHDLRADERESVLEARRRHKNAAILLHELGHNLGAPHEDTPDTIMNPMYSHLAASFSAESRELMLMTLDARLGRASHVPVVHPKSEASDHPSLVIVISPAGEASVDGKAMSDAALDELFRATFAADRNTAIVIKMGRNAPNEALVKLIDRANAAGLTRMAIGGS